jgi:hypothetical protein
MKRALFAVAAIVSLCPLLHGCGPSCTSSDLRCFLEHMVVVEPTEDGEPLTLVEVDRTKVKGSSSATPPGSGGGGGTPIGTVCDGVSVDILNDPNHCGGCEPSCAPLGPGSRCVNGACECGPGRGLCNGVCVDTTSDPGNCGGCGNSCGDAACQGSTCLPSCSPPTTQCSVQGTGVGGYACVDVTSNDAHCGGCNVACPPAHGCSGGQCVCNHILCMDPGQPPASAPAPEWISERPAPMSFVFPNQLHRLRMRFRDPHRCTPAVCFSLCSEGQCESSMMCVPPVADGLGEGDFEVYMGFLAENSSIAAPFDIELTPCSSGACGDFDPEGDDFDEDAFVEWLESGDAAAGPSISFEATVEPADSGYGGFEVEQCGETVAIGNCSVRACAYADSSRIGCWYETSVGRFDCGADCNDFACVNSVTEACDDD